MRFFPGCGCCGPGAAFEADCTDTDAADGTLTIAAPDTAENDLVFAWVLNSAGSAISTPSGWTQLQEGTFFLNQRRYWFGYIQAGASPISTPSWTVSSGVLNGCLWIVRGYGVPDDSAEATGSSGSLVAPSVTSAAADSVLICGWADTNGSHGSPPSPMVELYTATGGTSGSAAYELSVASGATGTRSKTGGSIYPWAAVSAVCSPL